MGVLGGAGILQPSKFVDVSQLLSLLSPHDGCHRPEDFQKYCLHLQLQEAMKAACCS